MRPLYWFSLALALEVAALGNTWLLGTSRVELLGVGVLHTAASGLAAWACLMLLPPRLQQPRLPLLGLMSCFAFIAPGLGALGLLALAHSTLRPGRLLLATATPQTVALPTYDVQTRTVARSGQGSIRSRLSKDANGALRMQSLLTLQVVPRRVANPILEDLLGDDTDDVRLVAFGMLDAQEKHLNADIQEEMRRLQQPQPTEQRFKSLRHLAELHWELVYASLAQGELRRHLLELALDYANQALDTDARSPAGLFLLRGRILLALNQPQAAQADLELAMGLGRTPASVLPYLAEIAYSLRDWPRVRHLLANIHTSQVGAGTHALIQLWVHPQTPRRDRRFLPHI